MSAAVILENLSCENKGGVVLRNINLTVEAGSCVAVAAGAGEGGRELLSVIAGRTICGDGSATLLGAPNGLSPLARQKISSYFAVSPGRRFFADGVHRAIGIAVDGQRTVRDILEKHVSEYRGIDREQLEQTADLLGVSDYLDIRYGALDECAQVMSCLAAVFAVNPRLIVLDEPFSALDISAAASLKNAIRLYTKKKGAACVVTVGALADPTQFCERALVMRAGRIIGELDLDRPLNPGRRYLYEIKTDKPHVAAAIANENGFSAQTLADGITAALTPRELGVLLRDAGAAGIGIYEARVRTNCFEDDYFEALNFMGGNLL